MGLLDKIKAEAQKSGSSKGKFFYVKEGEKRRIRFLQDMEDGFEVVMHSSYQQQLTVPCQEIFDRDCKYCEDADIKTRTNFAWSVYDYDADEVRIFMFAVNNCTPIAAVTAIYEEFGTLLDNDIVITVSGKQTNKTYTALPMNKSKFRNPKAKPYSRSAFLKLLDKAYPDPDGQMPYEETEKGSNTYKRKKDADSDEGFENMPDEIDYSEMTPMQLYRLCEKREIEAEPKMKAAYYINLLKEYDDNLFSGEEEEPEDEWADDEDDPGYEDMTAKELYELCKKRGLDALPRKKERYYINILEEADQAENDWGE